MKHIIVGTNRKGSRSRQVAELVLSLYRSEGEEVQLVDLAELNLSELGPESYGQKPPCLAPIIESLNKSRGIIFVVPEYNGSYPGALKYFIDFWTYPETFEFRPVCFIGLGGSFGALRPVEHLQGVFGYRNAFIFPQRVFIQNVWNVLKEGKLESPLLMDLLVSQTKGFNKFVKALESQSLEANSVNSHRPEKK